jgi:hypothetical protein
MRNANIAITALLLHATMIASAVAAPTIVRGRSSTIGNRVSYTYSVTNGSEKTIVTLLIGVDTPAGTGGQLWEQPIDWKLWQEERVGYGFRIPPPGAAAPPQWIPLGVLFEESYRMAVSFIVTDDNAPGIPPGQTISGFQVTVAKADAAYLNASFTAIFDDGTKTSGRIRGEQ